jgi:hypothetical protein
MATTAVRRRTIPARDNPTYQAYLLLRVGYLVAAWLAAIIGNLLGGGHDDVALRDVGLLLGALALARLATSLRPTHDTAEV